MKYRADIDGLRAIAIIIVFIFHLNDHLMPGGFIGVSVFFTISGFLICSIFLSYKEFRFFDFIKSRIKRLLPAIIFVITISLIIGIYIDDSEYRQFLLKLVRAITTFQLPQYLSSLFQTHLGYFGSRYYELTLQHFWSLNMEWIFYIGLATAYFIFLKYIKSKFYFFLFVIFISFLSIAYSTIFPNRYFGILSRIIEFSIGALIPFIPYIRIKYKNALSFMALLAIIIPAYLYNKNIPFMPGLASMVPIIGAAILIYFKDSFVNKILSFKIFVWIGLISYSLYLWHFVVIAHLKYLYGASDLSLNWNLIAIVLSVVLAIFSYFSIEKYFRYKKFSLKHFSIILILISISLASYNYIYKANQNKSLNTETPNNATTISDKYKYGLLDSKIGILLIGDSHAHHYKTFFEYLAKRDNFYFYLNYGPSCSPFHVDNKINSNRKYCKELEKNMEEIIKHKNNNIDIVIISVHWLMHMGFYGYNYFDSDPNYIDKLRKTIENLSKHYDVYLMADNNVMMPNPSRLYFLHRIGINVETKILDFSNKANAVLKEIAKTSNAHLIDIYEKLNIKNRIKTDDGKYMNSDTNHLSVDGIKFMIHLIETKYKDFKILDKR